MSRDLILLFALIPTTMLVAANTSVLHHCQAEAYTETINLPKCLSTPLSIKTTRCRGQCYSQDFLVYDWQYAPTHYRHKRHLHCCSPKFTQSHETEVMCENNKPRAIKYRLVTQCECKSCSDRCTD